MNNPKNLFYTKSHEWLKKNEDGTAYVGLTDFAQSELGDLVFVNLPVEGDPVTATVVAVNDEVADEPAKINESPYDAWLIQVADIEDTAELLSAEEYEAFVENQ